MFRMSGEYNLFLDDLRNPWKDITFESINIVDCNGNAVSPHERARLCCKTFAWVKSYTEFKDYIVKYGMPKLIMFDHDLNEVHMSMFFNGIWENFGLNAYTHPDNKGCTGYDCLGWMLGHAVSNKIHLPEIYIHTANPWGRANMVKLLDAFKQSYQ